MRLSKIFLFLIFFQTNQFSNAQNSLVSITEAENNIKLDIRYATKNNFTGDQLYNCAICLLRPEVANALKNVNNYFNNLGYRIVIFDCYRPLDIQKKMWEKVPNPTYVANPYTNGSAHNKGAAIDITLETLEGCYVEMGSDYDYFGRDAHIDNYNFSEEILENRKILIDGMRKFGFQTIRTEWWHFNFIKNLSYSTLNKSFPCQD